MAKLFDPYGNVITSTIDVPNKLTLEAIKRKDIKEDRYWYNIFHKGTKIRIFSFVEPGVGEKDVWAFGCREFDIELIQEIPKLFIVNVHNELLRYTFTVKEYEKYPEFRNSELKLIVKYYDIEMPELEEQNE